MIIGISGYIGSGKDTVGQLIVNMTMQKSHKLVTDEFGRTIPGENGGPLLTEPDYPLFEIKKFAAKLKRVASLLTAIPVDKFEDQEFKKTNLGPEWSYDKPLRRDDMLQENKYWETVPMTVREFLQRLGTDAIRDNLHSNTWVNALFADYKGRPLKDGYPELGPPPNWIITDCRFPNEAMAVKERGGIMVRVKRPGPKGLGTLPELMRHPSETGLDDWQFDHIIDNDGSMEDLIRKVKIFAENHLKNDVS